MIRKYLQQKKYYLIIIVWIAFIVISYLQFLGLNRTIEFLNTYLPETSDYELNIRTALMLMLIAAYLMLSPLIIILKNNLIKNIYYTMGALLMYISHMIIDQYYYENADFTNYMQFFNPSLLPFMFSIAIFIWPFIEKYRSINS